MKYRRARQTAWRTIAGETVLLDLAGKRMYGLSPTAAFIWLALETGTDSDRLLRAIRRGRDADFGSREIETFLAELAARGLAEEVRDPVPEDRDQRPEVAPEPPAELEAPAILWREEVEQIAGTCAFFPSTNPICNQAPFS